MPVGGHKNVDRSKEMAGKGKLKVKDKLEEKLKPDKQDGLDEKRQTNEVKEDGVKTITKTSFREGEEKDDDVTGLKT